MAIAPPLWSWNLMSQKPPIPYPTRLIPECWSIHVIHRIPDATFNLLRSISNCSPIQSNGIKTCYISTPDISISPLLYLFSLFFHIYPILWKPVFLLLTSADKCHIAGWKPWIYIFILFNFFAVAMIVFLKVLLKLSLLIRFYIIKFLLSKFFIIQSHYKRKFSFPL